MTTTESPQGPKGPNWAVRIVLGLVVVGGFAAGLMWFLESSRLSDRVNELIAQTKHGIYRPMLEGTPTVFSWLEQAPELWQPVIDSSRDLVGTSAEDAHFLTIDMRDAVMDYLNEIRAFELRSYQVISLLNSHPGSTLSEYRPRGPSSRYLSAELDLYSDVQIEDEEAMARLFAAQPAVSRDFYMWDNDLALLQAIRQGHGPALLERIAEISEETQSLTDKAREMSRRIHSKIAQSDLPERHRNRILADWNDFTSTFGGMFVPYEQNGRQFLVAYSRYVEYIMEDFTKEELQLERLYEIDTIRSGNLRQLRRGIEAAGW